MITNKYQKKIQNKLKNIECGENLNSFALKPFRQNDFLIGIHHNEIPRNKDIWIVFVVVAVAVQKINACF